MEPQRRQTENDVQYLVRWHRWVTISCDRLPLCSACGNPQYGQLHTPDDCRAAVALAEWENGEL